MKEHTFQMLDAIRGLESEIRARSHEIETGRRIPSDLAKKMAAAGLYRAFIPKIYGGLEIPPQEMMEVVAHAAKADGSSGWCLMIGMFSAVVSAYLRPEVADLFFGGREDVVLGGVYAPHGKAVWEGSGFRVRGVWPWASGCQNSDWLMGACILFNGDKPVLLPSGQPETRLVFFPARDVGILDTWKSMGLCGTGSHTMEVRDLWVPKEHSVSLVHDTPHANEPLYRFPLFCLLALGIASVALGIAQGAIEEGVESILKKVSPPGTRPFVAQPRIQTILSEAEGLFRSCKAQMNTAVSHAWDEVQSGACSLKTRLDLRITATHVANSSAQIVDLLFHGVGGSAVYSSHPLQRRFRDIHTALQHVLISKVNYETSGKVLLGLETDLSTF